MEVRLFLLCDGGVFSAVCKPRVSLSTRRYGTLIVCPLSVSEGHVFVARVGIGHRTVLRYKFPPVDNDC